MLVAFLLIGVQLLAESKFLIDIDKKTIASVSMKDTLPQLREKFGSKNVTTATENLEGESQIIIIINLNGHKVIKHWNHLSTKDPIFRTKEDIGVGSSVAEFAKYYGKPSVGEGEGGPYLNFTSARGTEFQVEVSIKCIDFATGSVNYQKCIVKEILL